MTARTQSKVHPPDIPKGTVDVPDDEAESKSWFSPKLFWAYVGPGWLMAIAYVDPGNLESDLQAGAYSGYQLVWVLLVSTVMGLFLQILAARLGVVTGKGLAEICRERYPRWVSLVIWIMTELAIVGSDIQVIIGSAIAFNILFRFPLWLGCLVTVIDTFTFLLLHRWGMRKLEAFFVALIAVMCACFFWNLIKEKVSASDFIEGITPELDSRASTQAVAILGAVIMPYNIFLHSSLVQSRRVDRTNLRKVSEANYYFALESALALLASFFINLAVLGVFAKGFYSPDCLALVPDNINVACVPSHHPWNVEKGSVMHNGLESYGQCLASNNAIGRCEAIGLSEAGNVLSLVLGDYARIIWAIGLLAAGQSATMTGTLTGQFVMEGFLEINMAGWQRVALTRFVALGPALIVALLNQRFPGMEDRLDELLNVLQSVQLPFAVFPVLHFSSDPTVMGSFVNSRMSTIVGWILGSIIIVINIFLIFINVAGLSFGGKCVVAVIGFFYFCFIGYIIKSDIEIAYKCIKASIKGGSEKEVNEKSLLPINGNHLIEESKFLSSYGSLENTNIHRLEH